MADFIVDAHPLLFYLGGNSRIGRTAKSCMDERGNRLVVPAIALAEALWIASSRAVGLTAGEISAAIDSDVRISV